MFSSNFCIILCCTIDVLYYFKIKIILITWIKNFGRREYYFIISVVFITVSLKEMHKTNMWDAMNTKCFDSVIIQILCSLANYSFALWYKNRFYLKMFVSAIKWKNQVPFYISLIGNYAVEPFLEFSLCAKSNSN